MNQVLGFRLLTRVHISITPQVAPHLKAVEVGCQLDSGWYVLNSITLCSLLVKNASALSSTVDGKGVVVEHALSRNTK